MVVEILTREDIKDFVTKTDLQQALADNNRMLLSQIGQAMRTMMAENNEENNRKLKADLVSKDEFKKEIASLRAEMATKADLAALRADTKADLTAMREEIGINIKKEFELNNKKLVEMLGKVMEKKLATIHLVMD